MSDEYAPSRPTTEGRVYNLTGGDWDEMLASVGGADPIHEERLVLNMGPQHPSTHGVLRLVVELEGETVTDMRTIIGYLHTGIEKNTEYRTWTQAVTFLTRADYLAPLFNEAAYCLAVEKLLGVTVPARAQLIRLMLMEINRVSSHWVALATGGMEMGALTAMTNGLRARERCLDVFELITGLRMNHAFIRPGGIAQDLPDGAVEMVRDWVVEIRKEINGLRTLVQHQPIWVNRLKDVGWLGVEGCLVARRHRPDAARRRPAVGPAQDRPVPRLRRVRLRGADPRRGRLLRALPRARSTRCTSRRASSSRRSSRLEPGPVWVDDPKIAWPAKLSVGPDGMGNSLEHVQKIMGTSMESLIHHFKLVTEGFRVPPGQAYVAVESPRGELGAHVVSDGGTRPYRVHLREPSFINLQSTAALSIGGMISDVIASVGSIDPVMGGVDR